MTSQTKCPYCGADASCCVLGQTYYRCGSFSHSTACVQSMTCELTELRAMFAAQQQLLREAAEALKDLEYVAAEVRKKLSAAT